MKSHMTTHHRSLKSAACAMLLFAAQQAVAQAPGAYSAVVDMRCDRQCLLGFADGYMSALARKDPSPLPLARDVRFTENNVVLQIGDGVWNSIGKVYPEAMRAADVESGNVSWFGTIEEHGKPAYYTMRMKVNSRRITEVETVISRLPDGPKPFGKAEEVRHDPRWNDVLPAAERRPARAPDRDRRRLLQHGGAQRRPDLHALRRRLRPAGERGEHHRVARYRCG
jgi:hypothetical protein